MYCHVMHCKILSPLRIIDSPNVCNLVKNLFHAACRICVQQNKNTKLAVKYRTKRALVECTLHLFWRQMFCAAQLSQTVSSP